MQLDPTSIALLSVASAGFGWLANHWLSSSRDRGNRQREFIAEIAAWRSKVHRTAEIEELAKEFHGRFDKLQGLASVMKRDLRPWQRARFDELCAEVREAGARVTETKDNGKEQVGRARLRDALSELEHFV